jgi:dihydrofolate reductase
MAPLVSLYISSTLDGYIARADGAIDWLTHIDENDTDYGYAEFYDSVDGILMGSTTFEMIQALGPWPYPEKPTFIFTNRLLKASASNIFSVSGDPEPIIHSDEFSQFSNLWLVGGSSLIGAFIEKCLIDEYLLTILPVVLGQGLRLFSTPVPEQWLDLLSCTQYDRGVLQLRYGRAGQ